MSWFQTDYKPQAFFTTLFMTSCLSCFHVYCSKPSRKKAKFRNWDTPCFFFFLDEMLNACWKGSDFFDEFSPHEV
jgi:hypothetical protein